MMVATLSNGRTARQILQVKIKAKYWNLFSRRMSNDLTPYGPARQENGTSASTTNSSKSNQNVAASIAIASILPMLIAIFLLVMIIMSVNNVFARLSLLT